MKKLLITLISAAVVVSAVSFTGCSGNTEEPKPTASTSQTENIPEKKATPDEIEEPVVDLMSLHGIKSDKIDDFAGAWQITGGVGSQYKSFIYMFDGDENSYLMMGSTGQCAKYSVKDETDENGNTQTVFTSKMMFGIDGKYTFEFSNEKQTLVLTDINDQTETTLQKLATYEYIPIPPKNSKTDEKLLGAWKNNNGGYLYFDKSGIMYETMQNFNFYFCTYNAENNEVSYFYYYTDSKQVKETVTYSVDGDTLIYDDIEYTRISPNELV